MNFQTLFSFLFPLLLLTFATNHSQALTLRTWDGGAGDNDFNNGINWSGNPASITSSDSCVMNLTGQTISLSNDITIGALTINGNSGWDSQLRTAANTLTINGDLNADTDNNNFSDLFLNINNSNGAINVLGNAYFDQNGSGIVYIVSIQNSPGSITYYGDVSCGNRATTATNGGSFPPGYEPNVIYDGTGTQTVTLDNTGTSFFLSENLTIGNVNTPTVNLTGTGVSQSFGTYDGNITINGTLDIGANFIIDCVKGSNSCPTLTITDGGALKIGGTGDFPNHFATDDLQLESHLYFYGTNQTICNNMSTASVGHLYLQGSGSKTWNIATEIKNDYSSTGTCTADIGNVAHDFNGDLSIGSGTTFESGSATHTIAGSFTMNGTFSHQNGKFTFDGNSNQNIDGNNPTVFDDIEIDNTAGITVIKGPKIEDNLTFTEGDITANAISEPVYITNTGSVTGAAANSHFVGYITKQTNSTSKFIFPVGDGTFYRPCAVEPAGNGDTEFLVKYFNVSFSDLSTEMDVYNVSNQEYWSIDRAGSSPEDAKVELSWNSNSGVNNINEVIVSHYNGVDWENTGVCSSSGNATNGQTITTLNWSSYSPFTLGSTTANNPLPVELLDWSVTCDNQGTPVLNWSTVHESNSLEFNILTSSDGVDFNPIASILATGNSSNLQHYQYIDDSFSDARYYLLSQTDYDGQETFYEAIACNCYNAKNNTLFPNLDDEDNFQSMSIYDITGKLIYEDNQYTSIAQISSRNNTLLNSGYYIVKVTGQKAKTLTPFSYSSKIVIQ